ncbi:unnamed protein product [Triticum turgidum subsp. durum]|uniref:DUF4220 domain-containing protein n=2 Tax=Triticum TaxID=4564 RepID=A0A9R1QZE4_TRITD|nr:unnamed protein product [Triticum aestivum]VAH86300.1 unnamed protein product [Triticum turgidum subsp. durum]
MGNMGQQHLENATSVASLLHQLRDVWKSPRGTVLRIEALALLAIFLSFFLSVFGSCRRWSNNFLIQKGFMAANALFLSLGTYSIGLMQSSRVKSEMYPIWAVSLLALLCCVDSVASSGLDSRNQLWKMLYQLCLYFGYVLLMSITTISSDIGSIAICVLSAVTFIKGFHRSMALVLPSSMRNMIREFPGYSITKCSFGDPNEERELTVDDKLDVMIGYRMEINMGVIASMRCKGNNKMLESKLNSCKDVCLSFSLSHLLHRHFLGLSSVKPVKASLAQPLVKNCKRALKVVEIELAFLHDILYTSNTFLHYYEAKSASIWAFASVIGICFVGAVAVMPGARSSRRASPDTIFVDTTIVDFVITGVVLVSLALLQVLQLLSCWTSNWARVAFACDYARKNIEEEVVLSWGMRLRASLLKINWYDKYYLWQNKLGQHAVVDESFWIRVHGCLSHCHQLFCCKFIGIFCSWICSCSAVQEAGCISGIRCILVICCLLLNTLVQRCFGLLGLQYISRELKEMLRGSCTGSAVELHPDVKASIGDFVDNEIKSNEISSWASSKVENGQSGFPDFSFSFTVDDAADNAAEVSDMIYVSCILIWHVATCYCELAQQCDSSNGGGHHVTMEKDHRRVAMDLSKYCAYLVASAPRLLPGRSETINLVYGQVREEATRVGFRFSSAAAGDKLEAMDTKCAEDGISVHVNLGDAYVGDYIYGMGVKLGKGLQSMDDAERWKVLADFWVKALVYAAPSDNVEEHMQQLSQGGELITHLWAMLYHAGIHKWQLNPPAPNDINMGWDYIFRIRSWKDLEPSHKVR